MIPGFGGTLYLAGLVRALVAIVVGIIALVCFLDWLVRTRRINPFHPFARLIRESVDPILLPIERRVVRAGGLPSAAPWWALAVAVVSGIVLISVVDFVLEQFAGIFFAISSGPMGLFVLLVHWTFLILQTALLVRVVVSWLPISPFSAWVRWAFVLSEPILRPLRSIIPTVGMFDITPLVAYFLLGFLEKFLLRLGGPMGM